MKAYLETINYEQQEFYEEFAEYVGGNEYLNTKKWERYLVPKTKNVTCYRYWQEIYDDVVAQYLNQEIKSIPIARQREYYACTKDLNVITKMIDDAGFSEDLLITQHSGKGIDVNEIMREAIKNAINEQQFIRDTYYRNEYQKEIIFFDPIYQLDEDNIVAYYNSKQDMIIPL
jgi:hypothetical protein